MTASKPTPEASARQRKAAFKAWKTRRANARKKAHAAKARKATLAAKKVA